MSGAEGDEEERGEEVDLEGVRKAGEETEGDKVSDDEGGEEREGGVRPEGVGGEAGTEGGFGNDERGPSGGAF